MFIIFLAFENLFVTVEIHVYIYICIFDFLKVILLSREPCAIPLNVDCEVLQCIFILRHFLLYVALNLSIEGQCSSVTCGFCTKIFKYIFSECLSVFRNYLHLNCYIYLKKKKLGSLQKHLT